MATWKMPEMMIDLHTMRAWFAGQALAGLCSIESAEEITNERALKIGERAVALADAVLLALDDAPQPPLVRNIG